MTAMYDFVYGEPAIVTEIYLPHKYARSPAFEMALRNSLLPRQVELHFTEMTKATIIDYLPPRLFEDKPDDHYDRLKGGVIATKRAFAGYSIHDVAGAFRSAKAPFGIVADANACVRIIDRCFENEPSQNSDAFERVTRVVFAFRLHHNRIPDLKTILGPTAPPDIGKAVDRLMLWIDEGTFLLFGFLGYYLCQVAEGQEEEIWLTSHFEVVNRYTRR